MFKHFLILTICFTALVGTAQTPKYRVVSIPVVRNGITLRDPWTGGMDSPQFSACDLNDDGIKDLFVFDRVGNRVLTFLGNGGAADTMYTYAPQYENLFPKELNSWVLLRDYNNDGVPDIFTHVGPGIRVYKGSRINGVLHFNIVSNYITYLNPPFNTNILALVTDVPAIVDVNGDGDLDILVYDLSGTHISYYENQTIEHQGEAAYAADSLKYQWVTPCWGGVAQNQLNDSIIPIVDSVTAGCFNAVWPDFNHGNGRHAGNSLCAIHDPVTDNIDLLNGNIGFSNIAFLRNGGTRNYAHITEASLIFPKCAHPMVMNSYPAAYEAEITGDGHKDILLAPNTQGPFIFSGGNSLNFNNVWYYQNLVDTFCYYSLQSDSFLVHHALDFGTNSRGVFHDVDGDGLTDIVVGDWGYYVSNNKYVSAIGVYRNTGSATQPQFTQVSADYDSLSKFHLNSMSPAFGDLDGDGHDDLLMGDSTGYLSFFKNAASMGSSFPSITTTHYFNLRQSYFSAPFIYDVNGDSLNDIVVGCDNGKLTYYWNYGTRSNPQFSLDSSNTNFGDINVCQLQFYNGCFSQPFIKSENDTLMLYVGSIRGTIFKYAIDPAKLRSGTFAQIDSNIFKTSSGANATISVADLNSDGKMEYLVGNAMGGLLMYSDSLWDPSVLLSDETITPAHEGLRIYPNPAREYFVCALDEAAFTAPVPEVVNILGQRMNVTSTLNNGKLTINAEQLTNGFYLVRIVDRGKTFTGKILLEK